jgi:hypothetical protein
MILLCQWTVAYDVQSEFYTSVLLFWFFTAFRRKNVLLAVFGNFSCCLICASRLSYNLTVHSQVLGVVYCTVFLVLH